MGSDIPDQKKIQDYDSQMNYLRTLTYRMDRSERADPLVRQTVYNKGRYGRLDSSGYGRLPRQA